LLRDTDDDTNVSVAMQLPLGKRRGIVKGVGIL